MDFKSLLIGALGSSLLFVSVGAGTEANIPMQNVGQYQGFSDHGRGHVWLLNTETAELYIYNSPAGGWQKKVEPNSFFYR